MVPGAVQRLTERVLPLPNFTNLTVRSSSHQGIINGRRDVIQIIGQEYVEIMYSSEARDDLARVLGHCDLLEEFERDVKAALGSLATPAGPDRYALTEQLAERAHRLLDASGTYFDRLYATTLVADLLYTIASLLAEAEPTWSSGVIKRLGLERPLPTVDSDSYELTYVAL